MLMLGCSLASLTSCSSAPKPNPPEVQRMVDSMIEDMRLQNEVSRQIRQSNLNR